MTAAGKKAPSLVGDVELQPDGSARCALHIPLGHPASRMLTINENVIEVENARIYVAGPGRTTVRAIDPQTKHTQPVGIDLLPTGRERAALTTTPEHLQNTLRRWAPVFDRCAHTPEAEAPDTLP